MFKIAKIFQIDDIIFQEKFFVSCQVHIGNGVKTDYIKTDAQLLRGNWSRVVRSGNRWAGGSACVPVCENMEIFVSLNPSFSYVLAGRNYGGSVPGYTGICSVMVCVKSMTFMLDFLPADSFSYFDCRPQ